jgi:phage gp36-like protein
VTYISKEDLLVELGERELVQLTNDSDTDEVVDAVVHAAIAYAEGVFESYVRTRYSLPVPATQLVKSSCVNLAVYQLYRKRATFKEGKFEVRETAYKETIALLRDLQAGKAALDVPAAEETVTNPGNSDKILTNADRNKYTDSKLRNF